jgi:dihydroxy-acid dehydratase
MVWENLTPEKILTRQAFENAIVLCSAIGGSTNAPIHINAIAAHAGVDISLHDWQRCGQKIPQLVNCQPVGEFLAEEFHRAGGVPALVAALLRAEFLHGSALTVSGKTLAENCRESAIVNPQVIKSVSEPVREDAGLMVLSGNLFNSAVMKVSAIDPDFHRRYLSNPDNPNVMIGKAVVFDGPEHYHREIDNPELGIDEESILVMRGAGPKGYPGSAEVINMQPPAALLARGVQSLPTIGDGRQSGTSGSPSILNASPEAADSGGLALLQSGDRIRIDLNQRTVNALVAEEEWQARSAETQFGIPESQTWWQQLYRQEVSNLDSGAIFDSMVRYRNIIAKTPRHSH